MPKHDLIVVGLGPGPARYLTREAVRALRRASTIWLRTAKYQFARTLMQRPGVSSFDSLYEVECLADVYGEIANRLVVEARRAQGVVYAVPGDPMIGEGSVPSVLAAAKTAGVSVGFVSGISLLEPVFAALELSPLSAGLQMVDALALGTLSDSYSQDAQWAAMLAPRMLVPIRPALISRLRDARVTAAVKEALLRIYPAEHLAVLVDTHAGRTKTKPIRLGVLDRARHVDDSTCLFLPPRQILEDLRGFDTFCHIVARLRAPSGCPWDREQSHQSLKPYLIEETYEMIEALDEGSAAKLEEELGDVLLQVVLHAQLATEQQDFEMGDVLAHISSKLIRRHPHVFGDRSVADSREVMRNWERIKQAEKGESNGTVPSFLGGVPKEMPALAHAGSIQRRVAELGFDWERAAEALDKVCEEAAELRAAQTQGERRSEYGDLLFALVSAGRWLGLDAEEALRLANRRFISRFTCLEQIARERGVALKELSTSELDRLWQEAKDKTI